MKRKDLKPGDVFHYADEGDKYTRSVEFWHPSGPAPCLGLSNPGLSNMESDVVLVWEAPQETNEAYDARAVTTASKIVLYEGAPPGAVTTQPHYTELTPEPIDVVQSWGLGFNLGNVVKYVARHGRKPGVDAAEDLKKARAYLSREIARLEGRNAWE